MSTAMPLTTPHPYPAYRPSGVPWLGDVPVHWEVVQLGRSGVFFKGSGGTKDDEVPDGIPCVRYGDLYTTHKSFISQTRSYVPPAKARAYTPINRGDVLFPTSGETIEEIGKSAVNLMHTQVLCGGDLIIFRPTIPMEPKFAGYALDCPAAQTQKSLMGRGITIMHIYSGQLKYLWLSLPPLSEQRAIVRYLDHADRRIRHYVAAKRKLIALLEEERKNATYEAIQSLDTRSYRLEVVANLAARPIERASDETYTPVGLYNRGRGIFKKEPRSGNELGDSSFFWVEEGDLVISGQFAWEGAIALASDVEHGCVASHRYPILRGKPGISDSGFLLSFFQTAWGQLLLDHHSRGAAGRNRPLNIRTLLKEAISLPPLESQLRISEMLQRESYVRQQVRLSEQLLTEYRTRLIADVVTGKLDVREVATHLPEEDDEDIPIDGDGLILDNAGDNHYDAMYPEDELEIDSEVGA